MSLETELQLMLSEGQSNLHGGTSSGRGEQSRDPQNNQLPEPDICTLVHGNSDEQCYPQPTQVTQDQST